MRRLKDVFFRVRFTGIMLISIISGFCQLIAQDEPKLVLEQHEYSFCDSELVYVYIEVLGIPDVWIDYEFNGRIAHAVSNTKYIPLTLNKEGTYRIISFGDSRATVTDKPDSIILKSFPSPQLDFSGGGIYCNLDGPDPLVANFGGVPPFSFRYLLNGMVETIDTAAFEYTFPVDEYFILETRSLADSNCKRDIEGTVIFDPVSISLPTIVGDTSLCESQNAIYSSEATDLTVKWDIPNGGDYLEGFNGEIPFVDVHWVDAGDHEVKVRFVDEEHNCETDTAILNVSVHPRPSIVELTDTIICFEQHGDLSVNFPFEPNDVIYWPELGVSGGDIQIDQEGTFSFIHTTAYNCSDTGSIVLQNNCYSDIHVPEAFTPNGDNLNDYLILFGLFDTIDFKIYSPQGTLIFQTNDREPYWDGTFEGKDLPSGSYFWHAIITGSDGRTVDKSGNVTIIR